MQPLRFLAMSNPPESSGSGQPSDQPFSYSDPGAQAPFAGQGMPQPTPGGALEPQAPNEPVLVTIGDISVTQTRVFTPSGTRPLNEVTWSVADMSVTSQAIPTWAIVAAIIGAFLCLIGLLFLLVKETVTKGSIQVTVHGPGFVHTTQIPVTSQDQVTDINSRVSYARTVTASYASPPPPGQAPEGGMGQQPGQGW